MEINKKENTHYDAGGFSLLDIIKDNLSPEQYKGFLLGNLIKYAIRHTCRSQWKGQETSDFKKASDYAKWLREFEDE